LVQSDLGIKSWAAESRERRGALLAAAALILVAVGVTPFASRQLPVSMPLLATLLTATILGLAINGLLLIFQARALRSLPTAVLATGFCYATATIVPYVLLYPGMYPPLVATLGGGMATISFLWFSAHAGILVSILMFFRLREWSPDDPRLRRDARAFIIAMAVVYVAITSTAIWSHALPGGFENEHLTPFFLRVLAPTVLTLAVVAIVTVLRRSSQATLLDLWLGIVALALIVEVYVAILGRTRFTVGWYTSATTVVVSELALLGMMLGQAASRYVSLVQRALVLENEAHTDTLTGLPNRRRFDEEFARAFGSAQRRDRPLAIAIADIDHFKRYNDAFGHQAGDRALHAIGRAIANSVGRSGDFAARYGGEEFVVILEETTGEGAGDIAERIRTGAITAGFNAPDGGPLTVSVGIAVRAPNERAEDLLRRADEALYTAKDGGRNRVAIAGDAVLADHR
jgi:diguanylate cyclase (GGDEF)-like protein